MRHRHLTTDQWTRDAIDSALEYGELADWRELFNAARQDRRLAAEVLFVSEAHYVEGASELAKELVREAWPDLAPMPLA
jgi:hypothetical protein